jgi:SAM-dependent methyltransferase
VLDEGCGAGRHLLELAPTGAASARVDLDLPFPHVRPRHRHLGVAGGDLRRLPLRSGSFETALCRVHHALRSSTARQPAALAEVARCCARRALRLPEPQPVAPGRERPARSREAPDRHLVRETSRFDPASGVDEGTRVLELPGGDVLRGRYRLRYYGLEELASLFASCGLRIVQVHGSVRGDDYGAQARDLIAWSVRV